MELVDTHCHIQSLGSGSGEEHTRRLWAKAGDLNIGEVLANAQKAGVNKMICVGCTVEDSELAVVFAADKPSCFAAVGIHPHEAKTHLESKASIQKVGRLLEAKASNKIVAVGEIGLDYYYEHSPKTQQKEVLIFQLELATKYKLPVIFHVRDAFDDFWPIYDEFKLPGVVHSFSSGTAVMEEILKRGLYVGLNGIMTFTNDKNQLEAAAKVPLDKLVLETDAPFLTPAPYRGTICQPKHVVETAKFLSSLRNETLEELAAATTKNAEELFNLQEKK